MASEVVRRIVHAFSTTGEEKVVEAYTKTDRAILSNERNFDKIERRFNSTARAQQDYARVQRQVNAAVAQNPALQQRANVVMAEAARRLNTASAANDNYRRSTQRATAAAVAFAASLRAMVLGTALTAGIGVFGSAASGKEFIQRTITAEDALQKLRAVLEATGGAAGVTEQQVLKMAAGLQAVTRHGDEAIVNQTAMLLSLADIGQEALPRAVEGILNLSTVMGNDLNAATVAFGKALSGNTDSLKRYGVELDGAAIKKMIEAGKQAEAYALILDSIEGSFGGSARAARDTLGGALDALANRWGDLFELSESRSDELRKSLERMTDVFKDPKTIEAVQSLGTTVVRSFATAVQAVSDLIHAINKLKELDAQLGEKLGRQLGLDPRVLTDPSANPHASRYAGSGLTGPTFDERFSHAIKALNDQLAEADKRARELGALFDAGFGSSSTTTDTRSLQDDIRLLQQRISLLGEAATATDRLALANLKIRQATEAGVTLSDREIAAIRERAIASRSATGEAKKLADATARAQMDRQVSIESLQLEMQSLFMSEEAARAAAIAQQELNRLKRAGVEITPQLAAEIDANARLVAGYEQQIEVIRTARDAATDFTATLIEGFANGESMAVSLESALSGLASQLIDMGSQNLVGNLFSGVNAAGQQTGGLLGGGLTSLLGLAPMAGGPIGACKTISLAAILSSTEEDHNECDQRPKDQDQRNRRDRLGRVVQRDGDHLRLCA